MTRTLNWETFLPAYELPLWWHVCGSMLVVALSLLKRSSLSSSIIVICLTRLPGVILHESAHFLVGILLRAEPTRFTLIPERCCDGRWTLGSVAFRRITAFNAVPIALAPLGLIPVALWLYLSWFTWLPLSLANTCILYGAVFLLFTNALPSRQDIRVACNWKSIFLYGSAGGLLWCAWGYLL